MFILYKNSIDSVYIVAYMRHEEITYKLLYICMLDNILDRTDELVMIKPSSPEGKRIVALKYYYELFYPN